VAEVVRLRLVMLAPATQRVLRLCAVTGDAMWLEPLAALAQLTAPALGEALGEAQQAGVLHGRRFAHELLRQAVLEPVPEAERAALHAGWLQLAGERLTPHARAMHAWAAGDQRAAVAATLQAATFDAQRGLHAAAEARMADALQRVAGTGDDDRAARAQLLACRARVRLEAGASDSALADAEAALAEDPGPETRADALAAQGDVALLQGRVADVPALAAAALEAVPGHDGALMLRVKWSHVQGDFAGAEAALRERLAGLRRAPAGAALVDVLTSLAAEIDHQGRHAEALPLHREAVALARRRKLRYAEVEATCNLLWCLPELGLHDEAVAVGEAAVALGEFDATPTLVNNLAWLYLDQGRLDDAARLYGRLVDTDDLAIRCSARAKLLQIDATAGRPVETAAQALLDAMRRTDHPQGLAIAALALLDHGPPALHAAAAALAPRVPLDPSLQSRLDAALARRGPDR
jgi:tetratricopeptide (TPR) repeat protein